MKKIVLVFVLLSSMVYANPGKENKENSTVESFKIIVIDAKTEEPIPAAQIKIKEKNEEAYTDFDGFAEIKNITPGTYDIEISLISYKKEQLKNFELNESNHQLLVKLNP